VDCSLNRNNKRPPSTKPQKETKEFVKGNDQNDHSKKNKKKAQMGTFRRKQHTLVGRKSKKKLDF